MSAAGEARAGTRGAGRLEWPPDLLTERSPSRLGDALWILAVVALAFWDLGGRAIYHRDLPRFAVIAREMLRSGDWLVPTQHNEIYANKPILFIWLVALPSAVLGDPTAFTLRLPSALALVATVLGTSLWGRARTGSVVRGRLAGLLVGTTFLVSELGRVGRPDMLSTACSTVAAALLDRRLLGGGGRRDPWWVGLWLGAGLLSKGPVALLLPLAVVLVPRPDLGLRARLARGRLSTALPVALGVAALWIVPAWIRGGSAFIDALVVRQTVERVSGQGNHREPFWYYPPELLSAGLPWVLAYATLPWAFVSREVRRRLGGGAHVAAAGVAFLVLCAVPTKQVRYAAILFPPLAVASVQVLVDLVGRARDGARWTHALRALSVTSGLAAAAIGVVAASIPTALPWVVPPAILLALGALGGWRHAQRERDDPRRLAGRTAALAVLLSAAALCCYWSFLGRRAVHSAVLENDAVTHARRAGVPAVLFASEPRGGIEPDDLYTSLHDAPFVTAASALPTPAVAPRLDVVCVAEDLPLASAARAEAPVVALERVRRDGRTLVVLRFGER